MSEIMSKTENPFSDLTDNDILEWLKANPDFLQKHPNAFEFLLPPKGLEGKNVTDFQSYMIERLKNDRDIVIEEAKDIIETSRANMNNQARIHRAILMCLEARNFEDFIHTITMDFVSLLDIDIVVLIVESDGAVIPHINFTGVHMIPSGTIGQWLEDQKIVLQDNIGGIEAIYGGGAGLVKSQALVRLNIGNGAPDAMIAFGSRDPDMFQPGQGTELITFLGDIIERRFHDWLDIQT